MTISEESRHEMYVRLEDVLGRAPASTLMEHLPPVGWADVATRRDLEAGLAATGRDLEAGLAATRRDLEAGLAATRRDLDVGLAATRRDLESGFTAAKRDLDSGLALVEERLTARLHQELATQLRVMVFAVISSIMAVAGLAFTAR